MTTFEGWRDGTTFDPFVDMDRLNDQMKRVYSVMKDSNWRTLAEIASATGDPEASVSARLRDFRKARFGSFQVNRRRKSKGTYEYQILLEGMLL